eukprot:TRINITY_DN17667_c0_g1_i2.p1 TRINITY_DN17667_c0_g1~~TRINITY_DN17667_c0_g1_i2.p1  ORF type:complete len:264 (+),score=45.57 TRINITY_DN17667_c0_g1_i2:75-866(+)
MCIRDRDNIKEMGGSKSIPQAKQSIISQNYPLLSKSNTNTRDPFFPILARKNSESSRSLLLAESLMEGDKFGVRTVEESEEAKVVWRDDTGVAAENYQAGCSRRREAMSVIKNVGRHDRRERKKKEVMRRLTLHRKGIATHLEKRRSVRKAAYSIELSKTFRNIANQLKTYAAIGNGLCDITKKSLVFKDPKCSKLPIAIHVYSGIGLTLPRLYCGVHRKCFLPPTIEDVISFLKTIFERMELPDECSVITLIYIERLIVICP